MRNSQIVQAGPRSTNGKMRNAYKILIGKSERKTPLERSSRRCG
jgi:hypothetical protein